MQIEEIAEKVWSAGDVYIGPSIKTLEMFAELVRANERESCAKVCDDLNIPEQYTPADCAEAIRARS